VLYNKDFAEFQGHKNMNISNVALLLAAGNVADEIPILHNKVACLLLHIGAP
jgi:hypothetical protein